MQLPFSHDAFLEVFGAYNLTWWPAELALWVVTAAAVARWLTGPGVSQRALMALLALHWAWSGVAYHWAFFRAINPAATLFAVAFVLESGCFVWLAARPRSELTRPGGVRGALGVGLAVYSLIYPVLGLTLGLSYPRLPLFGVPCPSTLLTAGVLIAGPRVPRVAVVVPVLWTVVGGSAALLLGMTADLALIGAGAALAIEAAMPSALGPRG